jgi:hypothetical protein
MKSLAIGDQVRLTMRAANMHQSYKVIDQAVAPDREPVDGIIFAIRDISKGTLVASTEGDFDNYVIEILFDRTFNPRYADYSNAPKTVDRPSSAPRYIGVKKALKDAAEKGVFYSTSNQELWADSPLVKHLKGWKIIKVRSNEIETMEIKKSE